MCCTKYKDQYRSYIYIRIKKKKIYTKITKMLNNSTRHTSSVSSILGLCSMSGWTNWDNNSFNSEEICIDFTEDNFPPPAHFKVVPNPYKQAWNTEIVFTKMFISVSKCTGKI